MKYKNQIQLYPTDGRLITLSGNYNFTTPKDISLKTYSNGFIYLDFLKTLMPSDGDIKDANLFLHIADIGGIVSKDYEIVVDVYTAIEKIDSTQNIEQVRDLRGKHIGEYSFNSNTISDESIKINIIDYVENYIYGSNTAYGIIIEPKIKDLPSMSLFSLVYDEDDNRAYLVGGNVAFLLEDEVAPYYNMETYIYDIDDNILERIKDSNRPPGRIEMAIAQHGEYLYMYGGKKHASSNIYYNDLWRFNLNNHTWEQLETKNNSPGYLSSSTMVIQDNFLYLFFGKMPSGSLSDDIWMMDLSKDFLEWKITSDINPSNVKSASSNVEIVDDKRSGHNKEYYLIGGATGGSEIYHIKLDGEYVYWLNKITKDNLAEGYGFADFYDGYIYYFVGYSNEPSDNSENRNNILYKINPDTLSVEELPFEGEKLEKRSGSGVFIVDSSFYVINGYLAWGTLRNSSSIWYTDLSSSPKRWIEAYDKRSLYNTNANTIRIAPITSLDSSGEKQAPFIDLNYKYSTNYNVEYKCISPIITKDTYISYNNPHTNYGSDNIIDVQEPDLESGVEKRGLFYLDLSSIADNNDIISAILYIPRNTSSNNEGLQNPPSLITHSWTEDQATWVDRKLSEPWSKSGGDFEENYNSYNLIVGSDMCRYDVTRLLQQTKGSFDQALKDYYGIAFYDQNVKFDSIQLNDSSYLIVKYIDGHSNKNIGEVSLISPTYGEVISTTPVFKFKVPYHTQNASLHFKLEISSDITFSDERITSYSTEDSVTGWSWNASGDDTTYIDFPENGILGYTEDVSLIKFDISAVSASLSKQGWFWRVSGVLA
jgi:N-acetylneuraminic acid mutarotase